MRAAFVLCRSSRFFFSLLWPIMKAGVGGGGSSLLCSTVCVSTTVHTCFESCSAGVHWILIFKHFASLQFPLSVFTVPYRRWFLFSSFSVAQNQPNFKWFYLHNCLLSFFMFEIFSVFYWQLFFSFFFQLLQGKLQAKEVYKVSCRRKFSDSSREVVCDSYGCFSFLLHFCFI